MNNINSTNNVNFSAKLNINGLKKDKERWQNISKIFEEKTAKQYPDDSFILKSNGKNKGINIADDNECINNGDGCIINEKLYNKLMELPDDKIAGKLKKLMTCIFRPSSYATKLAAKVRSLADEDTVKRDLEYGSILRNEHWKEIDDFELMIYSAVAKSLRKKADKTIANDSILKHLDMEIF